VSICYSYLVELILIIIANEVNPFYLTALPEENYIQLLKLCQSS
jgi:hypothetical protein